MNNAQSSLPLALLWPLLALTYLILRPACDGPFLFDDYPNLSQIGAGGGVHSWDTFWRFVNSGFAGPGGRPLALMSFLIDSRDWPAAAYPFKHTNLIIHIINGGLVFWLAQGLAKLSPLAQGRKDWLALAVAAFWLLLPAQIASVFLVVQRMTLLYATFSLLTLIGWLQGREYFQNGQTRKGLVWMTLSLGVGGMAALLCKETAALLPLMILVLEATLAPMSHQAWKAVFLWLPNALIVSYFVANWTQIGEGFAIREFTRSERLLTEPLILWDYLYQYFWPQRVVLLFFEDFQIAGGWVAGLAVMGWLVVLVAAIYWRKRLPVLAFALLFFIVGHLLEAGPVSLELYFLHRNYLPIVGIVFALLWLVFTLPLPVHTVALTAALAFTATTSYAAAKLWGDEGKLVLAWADKRPASVRSVSMAANWYASKGQVDESIKVLQHFLEVNPSRPTIWMAVYGLQCQQKREDFNLWNRYLATINRAELDNAAPEAAQGLWAHIQANRCTQINGRVLAASLQLLADSPRFVASAVTRSNLFNRKAEIEIAEKRYAVAAQSLQDSFKTYPLEATLRAEARVLEMNHQYPEAIAVLEKAQKFVPTSPHERHLLNNAAHQADLKAAIAALQTKQNQQLPP